MSDMQDIIDEALKGRAFAGHELNLRQRLEIAKHLDAALAARGYGSLCNAWAEGHDEARHGTPVESNPYPEVVLLAHGSGEMESTLTYSGNVRGASGGSVPDGWDIKDWHRDAMADTGTSHSLHGRLYVVQCEWCPEAFAAPTKAEAMVLFRKHEADMQAEGTSLAAAMADPEGRRLADAAVALAKDTK